MSKFIKYKDSHSGASIYLNVSAVSQAEYDPGERTMKLIIGDPGGRCEERYLHGQEAASAAAVLDALTK